MTDRTGPAQMVSLSRTLANVGGELRQMRFLMAELEGALFGWTGTFHTDAPPPIELHNLDLLVQSADELASFIDRVTAGIGGDLHLDLRRPLADVRLGRLKISLGRVDAQPRIATDRPRPSTIDLF